MLKRRPKTGFSLAAIIALLLFQALVPPAWGEPDGDPAGAPSCPGQISSLETLGEQLLVGTPAGLYVLSARRSGRLEPVPGVDRKPVMHLSREGDSLALTFGNFESLGLSGWNPLRKGFDHIVEKEKEIPPDERHYHRGFLVSGRMELDGEVFTATRGGGLFQGDVRVAGSPDQVTAMRPWDNGLVIGSTEGLYYWQAGSGLRPLFENPCRDCRITCFGRWQGKVYAGTLGGGVISLPGYEETGGLEGLSARINALASTPEALFIGTEDGIITWDGQKMRPRPDISAESIKAMGIERAFLYFATQSGLKRYRLDTGKVSSLTLKKGAFMALFQGDVYLGGMFGVWHVRLKNRFEINRVLHENVTGFAVHENSLYAAGYYGGLWKISGSSVTRVADGQFSCIASGPGGIFLGTGSEGVMFFNPDTGEMTKAGKTPWPADNITALMSDEDRLYVGTPAGYSSRPWKDVLPAQALLPLTLGSVTSFPRATRYSNQASLSPFFHKCREASS